MDCQNKHVMFVQTTRIRGKNETNKETICDTDK